MELFEVRPLTVVPDQEVAIRWRVSGATRVELNPLGSVDVEGSSTHYAGGESDLRPDGVQQGRRPTTRTLMVRVRAPTIRQARCP